MLFNTHPCCPRQCYSTLILVALAASVLATKGPVPKLKIITDFSSGSTTPPGPLPQSPALVPAVPTAAGPSGGIDHVKPEGAVGAGANPSTQSKTAEPVPERSAARTSPPPQDMNRMRRRSIGINGQN